MKNDKSSHLYGAKQKRRVKRLKKRKERERLALYWWQKRRLARLEFIDHFAQRQTVTFENGSSIIVDSRHPAPMAAPSPILFDAGATVEWSAPVKPTPLKTLKSLLWNLTHLRRKR